MSAPAVVKPSMADIQTAYAWGLNLDEWFGLSSLARADLREDVVNAPRFEADK